MSDTPLKELGKNDMAMLLVGLAMPKLVAFCRQQRGRNLRDVINESWYMSSCITNFFNLPQNASLKKAYMTTAYASNPALLAKKIAKYV